MQDSLQCESNDRIFTVVKWKKTFVSIFGDFQQLLIKPRCMTFYTFHTDYSMYYIDVCICFSSLS